MLLQYAKQLHLKAQAGLRYLVQKNRAAIGCLKQAAAAGIRSGERALLMSEQLALQNGLGEGAAVDGSKSHLGACAVCMNRSCYKFLAGPAGTGNEDISRAWRDSCHGSIDFQHLRTSSNDRRLGSKTIFWGVPGRLPWPCQLAQQREQFIDQ